MQSHPNTPPSRNHFPALDGLRGLAVLMVVVWHYGPSSIVADYGEPFAYVRKALGLAWSGVDLFFVLSGFLIGGILIDQRVSFRSMKTFYLRRIFRILPVYLLLLVIFIIFILIHVQTLIPSWHSLMLPRLPLWTYFMFLQNFRMTSVNHFGSALLGPTWSLAVEEQFYLLLPLALWKLPVKSVPYLCLFVIAACPIFRLSASPMGRYTLLPARADALMWGVLVAWAVRDKKYRSLLLRNRGRILLVQLGLLVAAACYIQFGNGLLTLTEGWGTLNLSWIALFYALVVASVVLEQSGLLARCLAWRPLRFFGLISYGLYLFHTPFNFIASAVLFGRAPRLSNAMDLASVSLAFITSVIFCVGLHSLLEKPMQKIGRSFSY